MGQRQACSLDAERRTIDGLMENRPDKDILNNINLPHCH